MFCGGTMSAPYWYLRVHKRLRRVHHTSGRLALCARLIFYTNCSDACRTSLPDLVHLRCVDGDKTTANTLLYSFTALRLIQPFRETRTISDSRSHPHLLTLSQSVPTFLRHLLLNSDPVHQISQRSLLRPVSAGHFPSL